MPFPEPFPRQPWRRLWVDFSTWQRNSWLNEDFAEPAITGRRFVDWSNLGADEHPYALGDFCNERDWHVIVLLGGPEAGKSTELEDFVSGSTAILVRAKEIAEPLPQHFDRVFDGVVPTEDCPTVLLFDSLDESTHLHWGKNSLESLIQWLKQRDGKYGFKATKLIMSCRWSDWPEAKLRQVVSTWSSSEIHTLVLLPITSADARSTASTVLGDKAEPFWRELRDRSLASLACWPHTFIELLAAYDNSGRLPESSKRLIEQFVDRSLRVTTIPDDGLRQQSNPQSSTWTARVAGRLAASMFFSKCGIFQRTLDLSQNEGVLSTLDLLGTENWISTLREVTDADVEDLLLRTSLLRRLPGGNRSVFYSHVVQEFLAAKWIADQKLSLSRLLRLFATSGTEPRVFPQLRALAALVAERATHFNDWIVTHDAGVLLYSDHSGLTPESKRNVVEALLHYTARTASVDSSVWQSKLHTLNHPELLEQLRRWLEDQPANPAPAELALEIASKTKPAGLAELLWSVLPKWRPQDTPRLVRVMVDSVAQPESSEWLGRWHDVLNGKTARDGDGLLLGTALRFMVPRHCPVRDVADWLVVERRFNVIGAFSFFLWSAGEYVTLDDVPAVLTAMAENETFGLEAMPTGHPLSHETWVPFQAVKLAFANFGTLEIRKALEAYWIACLNYTQLGQKMTLSRTDTWIAKLGLTNEVRRGFAIHLLSSYRFPLDRQFLDAKRCFILDHNLDGIWLLEQTFAASGELRKNLAPLCRDYFWRDDYRESHRSLLTQAWNASVDLRQSLPPGDNCEEVLNQITRRRQEAAEKQSIEAAQWDACRVARENELQRNLKYSFQCVESSHRLGKLVWPEVYALMLFKSSAGAGAIVSHSYVLKYDPIEEWMKEAAERYLLDGRAEGLSDEAGLQAQLALTCLGPQAMNKQGIEKRLRETWLPWMLNSSCDSPPDWLPQRLQWLDRYPDYESQAFALYIKSVYTKNGDMHFLFSWWERWTKDHTCELERLLTSEAIHKAGAPAAWLILADHDFDAALRVGVVWIGLLPELVAHEHNEASTLSPTVDEVSEPAEVGQLRAEAQFAIQASAQPFSPNDGVTLATSEMIISLMLMWAKGRFWSTIQPLIPAESQAIRRLVRFGHEAGSRLRTHRELVERRLECTDNGFFRTWESTEAVAGIAELLWSAFPRPQETRQHFSLYAHQVIWEDEVIELHAEASREASARGVAVTPPSAAHAESPAESETWERQQARLRYQAQMASIGSEWQPIAPKDFLDYARKPEAHLARSNDELVEAIREALDDWEREVQSPGGRGHVFDFNTKSPHDEPIISKGLKDWLLSHVRIIGTSESQPFQTNGQRLDVLLQWPLHGREQNLSLVIEVKKDTHPDVMTEMKDQLLDRYLAPMFTNDPSVTHGVYLVVAVSGRRGDTVSDGNVANLISQLKAQALSLSANGFKILAQVVDARP